jgi:tellurite resistance protein TehA-like permease
MSIFGDALIIVGIGMLLFSFFVGYLIYTDITQNPGNYVWSTNPNPSSPINASVSDLINNLSLTVDSESLIAVRVVILFLFASVGYKIAELGMRANHGVRKPSKDDAKGA